MKYTEVRNPVAGIACIRTLCKTALRDPDETCVLGSHVFYVCRDDIRVSEPSAGSGGGIARASYPS